MSVSQSLCVHSLQTIHSTAFVLFVEVLQIKQGNLTLGAGLGGGLGGILKALRMEYSGYDNNYSQYPARLSQLRLSAVGPRDTLGTVRCLIGPPQGNAMSIQ